MQGEECIQERGRCAIAAESAAGTISASKVKNCEIGTGK